MFRTEVSHVLYVRKKNNIFPIIDQTKVSREPLLIGHCHFCTEVHLNFRSKSGSYLNTGAEGYMLQYLLRADILK